jgi:inner membrane transporter RhtA
VPHARISARTSVRTPVRTAVRPVWLVLLGIASVQFGAAFAKLLFDEVTPTTMVWLRLLTSALVLLVVARSSWGGRSAQDWGVVLAFGASLAVMNWSFYQSFARIPLGVAVTFEFLGPLTVALLGSRRLLDLLWVALAGTGVALLGAQPDDLDPVGVLFALLAGAAWASYIYLSTATGSRWPGVSGLAPASLVGAVALAPFAVAAGGSVLLDPRILAVGLAVGLLSSVIPYSLELVALRSMPQQAFGILMSLEPAAAALAGVLLLGELLGPAQWAAIACVVVASVGITRTARPVGAGQVAAA